MDNKIFCLGILVMTLIFGMAAIGCGDGAQQVVAQQVVVALILRSMGRGFGQRMMIL